MLSPTKKLLAIMHRIDKRGGQERSTLEYLTRLARLGWEVEILCYSLEDWPAGLPVKRKSVPGKDLKPQLIKNLWFSIFTFPYAFYRGLSRIVLTTGTSSWYANIRVIQFCHAEFLNLIRKNRSLIPNPRSRMHVFYQLAFSIWNTLLEISLYRVFPCKFIAISENVSQSLSAAPLHIKENRIAVIHHAPDERKEIPPVANANVQLLFVGALERKGIEKALRCLASLTNYEWKLNVLGEGNINHWQDQCRKLGVSERVEFVGFNNPEEYYQRADILFFPSFYEPFGLVVTEAVSHGVLPLASSECGAMELWTNRPDWLNLSAFDVDDRWIEALRRLLCEPKLVTELKAAAAGEIQKRNWLQVGLEYDAVLGDSRLKKLEVHTH